MDKLRKIGLTALAGTFAATSAQALEMSVSGSAGFTFATADNDEPIRKLTPVRKAFSGRNRTRITNINPTNPASTVYSVRRKAIAPERINAEMRCITSVPGSRLLIVRIKIKAKTAAAKGAPHPSAKYSCCSIHSPIVLWLTVFRRQETRQITSSVFSLSRYIYVPLTVCSDSDPVGFVCRALRLVDKAIPPVKKI